MRVLIRRLWHLLRLSSIEADLAEDMDFHREMKERELARLGTSPAETASAARRALARTTPIVKRGPFAQIAQSAAQHYCWSGGVPNL